MMKTSASIFSLLLVFFVSTASAADSEEGWIIKKTKSGIIKIPKKQNFKFGGSNIEGSGERPSETVLGTNQGRKEVSLIPLRTSFKGEALESMDYK